jgi:hypothetical protein
MSKAISLRGDPLPGAQDANAELIEMLATMLDEARAGQLVGMAFCANYRDGALKVEWSHQHGQADRLSTGLLVLQRDFTEAWVE